jgi:hypothetical protein
VLRPGSDSLAHRHHDAMRAWVKTPGPARGHSRRPVAGWALMTSSTRTEPPRWPVPAGCVRAARCSPTALTRPSPRTPGCVGRAVAPGRQAAAAGVLGGLSPRKIDAAVAAVLAYDRYTWHLANPRKRSTAHAFRMARWPPVSGVSGHRALMRECPRPGTANHPPTQRVGKSVAVRRVGGNRGCGDERRPAPPVDAAAAQAGPRSPEWPPGGP